MFEKVLIPTDFSKEAQNVLECMGEIPGLKEAILLNVVDAGNPMNLEKKGWSYSSLIDEAEMRLSEQAEHAAHLGKKDIVVRTLLKIIIEPMSGADGVDLKRPEPRSDVGLIEGGSISEAIQKTAVSENVSLIIMGAHGKGLVEGILLGSVSTGVLGSGQTDLLIIRHPILEGVGIEKFCTNIFSKVLITTDFSSAAEGVMSLVKGMANVHEIHLVHVISKGKSIDEPAKKLNLLREFLEFPGGKITVHVLEGNPANEILTLAKKVDASLIIMSSQGKSWLNQIRVGSTTSDVARRADRPMMVVRPNKL
jgi:nucleotide-binding universal stress UspA family protein